MNAAGRQYGFSFVEIMIALLLLAVCALPMAEAVKNGVTASAVATESARELRCTKNTMESVLAEPYDKLSNAALGKDTASGYSQPKDGACLARKVYIARYEREYGKSEYFLKTSDSSARLEAALLYITVASDNGFSFTTLVAR